MLVSFSKLGKFGRLGNSMFQIAATLAYGLKHNRKAVFPFWTYGQEFQNPLYQNDLYFLCHPNLPKHKEPSFTYSEIPVRNEIAVDLEGYFQSEKYFVEYKKEILEQFRFSFQTRHSVFNHIQALLSVAEEGRLAAIHIRRGDYVDLQDYHPVLPSDYYEEGLELINGFHREDNLIYLVFSDDYAYAESLYGKKHGFICVRGTKDITDMYLMSVCNYHLIANSSFSWWGAYLSKSRLVVAPGGKHHAWFGPKGPDDISDLIPSEWAKI